MARDLTEREQAILRAVIHTAILRGQPVGSRTIAKMEEFSLSPATIRNTMAELEAMGYLYQPHTSAGRLPTDQGYRFYVDELLDSGDYSWNERSTIDQTWLSDADTRGTQFRHLSGLLSRFSKNIGVVLAPSISRTSFQHIGFIRLDRERILVVFVSEGGIVHNRIIQNERDYSQSELDSLAKRLNALFCGLNLVQVRRDIVHQLALEPTEITERFQDALLLGRRFFEDVLEESEVYFEGTSNLLDKPEFSSAEHLKRLLRIFEHKRRLVQILDGCIEQEGLNVIIGSENKFEGFRECSVIASTYGTEDHVLGSLAIIGPTRIEYGKMIPFVDSVAHLFSESILGS